MENSENQGRSSIMKNLFTALVLFGFLVLLPVGSWFYLKKGADFRMQQLEELKTKASFDYDAFKAAYNGVIPMDSFENRAILVGNDLHADEATLQQQITDLEEQYAGSDLINICVFASKGYTVEWGINEEKFPKIFFIPGSFDGNLIVDPIIKPVPSDFTWMLVDNKGAVRNYYTSDQFSDLIVQTAVILPTPKREKIDLER